LKKTELEGRTARLDLEDLRLQLEKLREERVQSASKYQDTVQKLLESRESYLRLIKVTGTSDS
jgi:ubiquinone biosynthesis protein UbiJ